MWYQEIPEVPVLSWLFAVINLFNSVLIEIWSFPVLRVFLSLAVFMVAVALVQLLLKGVQHVTR